MTYYKEPISGRTQSSEDWIVYFKSLYGLYYGDLPNKPSLEKYIKQSFDYLRLVNSKEEPIK